jgi:ubiquinone/menaquinone biosynthesis C-methylase UbiE
MESTDTYTALRVASPVFRDGARIRAETIASLVAGVVRVPDFAVLDVGAADGATLEVIRARHPACHAVGVEPDGGRCKAPRSRGLDMVRGRGQSLPFHDTCFDVVIVASLLKHIASYETFVLECRRVLKPGGSLVLSDPTPWGICVGLCSGHFRRRYIPSAWSAARARRELAKLGLEPLKVHRFMLLPTTYPGRVPLEAAIRHLGLPGPFLQQAIVARRNP